MKELLFSVSAKDCIMQTFRCASAGGQNGNKVNSGVRLIHEASGAIGEGREFRDQLSNKKKAWVKLVHSKEFTNWYKLEASRIVHKTRPIEKVVDEMMQPENIKIEFYTPKK